MTKNKSKKIVLVSKQNKKSNKPKPVLKISTKPRKQQGLVSKLHSMNLLGNIGGALGNIALPGVGGSLGQMVGNGASTALNTIFGRGAYQIKENSLMSNDVPSFGDFASVPIKHREFVANVTSSTTQQISKYVVNPANSTLFDWLPNIAIAFQEYRIKGMIFEYKTLSGSVSSNPALGAVYMCCQYDPYQIDPTTKQSIENTEGSTSVVPCSNAILPIECKSSQTVMEHLYVNNSASGDKRMSIFGNVYVGVGGQSTNGDVLGELWVSYDIEFYKKIPESLPLNAEYSLFTSVFAGASNIFGFSGNSVYSGFPAPYHTSVNSSTSTITFQPGTYYVKIIALVPTSSITILPTLSAVQTGSVTTYATGVSAGTLNYANNLIIFAVYSVASTSIASSVLTLVGGTVTYAPANSNFSVEESNLPNYP